MQIRERIKNLIGENVDEKVLDVIIDLSNENLLNRLRAFDKDISAIPDELSFIVVEVSIKRFNRIGSEGIEQENQDGYSAKYLNLFDEYDEDIKAWALKNGFVASDDFYRQGDFNFL